MDLGLRLAIDSGGRTFFVADAHRGDEKVQNGRSRGQRPKSVLRLPQAFSRFHDSQLSSHVNQFIVCCGILRQILARTDMAMHSRILPTKVVGIGLNKTGTKTLGACLRHWGSDHISCSREGFDLWTAANTETLMHIVERHQSFEDWPWPLVYREIDQRFPGTKFVLTRRTTPEAWFPACANTLTNRSDGLSERDLRL